MSYSGVYNDGQSNFIIYAWPVRSGQSGPPAPTLTYPADGAVLNDSTPDLAWSQAEALIIFMYELHQMQILPT